MGRQHPSLPDPREPPNIDCDVKVDSCVHGRALAPLTLRQPGGEIPGGCADPIPASPIADVAPLNPALGE